MSSPDERRMYDWSLSREDNTETYIWPYEVDVSVLQEGDPPPQVLITCFSFSTSWEVFEVEKISQI